MAEDHSGPEAAVDPVESVDEREQVSSARLLPAEDDTKTDEAMNVSTTPTGQTPDHDSINGNVLNGNHVDEMDAEDDLGNEELTPPPDTPASPSVASVSPVAEPMSRDPSVAVNALEDEIVVGTNANKKLIHKDSPLRVVSEPDDVDMDDIEHESVASQKRKRNSTYIETPDEGNSPAPRSELPDSRPRPTRPIKPGAGVKGVLLGYWRDSEPQDIADKHAVIGFIDIRDRLRTRIQPTTRDGRNIVNEYPLPPGPGGSWVTFQQVAFDSHLVYLNQHQVKDYVKLRLETLTDDETPEQKEERDRAAVKEAIRRSQETPAVPYTTEPLVAYGTDIPEHAQPQSRPEAKKRRIAQQPTLGVASTTIPAGAFTQHHPLDTLPGTRPTRILLGHWKLSDSLESADKHAVYGILGANDMFRVKLMRETRDGRPVIGNFPLGAGALWIHWDEVVFEPHLHNLTRPEIKEYCRVRQRQLDEGETEAERVENEAKAVYEAQKRVASGVASAPAKYQEYPTAPLPLAMKTPVTNGNGHDDSHHENGLPASEGLPHLEPRQSRQLNQVPQAPRARHSLPDVELRAANRPPGPSALERTNSIARREIARVEAAAQRAEQRAEQRSREPYAASPASRAVSTGIPSNKSLFDDNMSRLNKVWATQEANRLKAGAEDAKIYMGIKYERKQNGPFEGKLVSQGTIISIDGEDYVEYRVLTKPSFF